MMRRRMWSLAIGLVCAGMALSVSGHAGWAPQTPEPVASMSALSLPAFQKPITKRFVNASLSEVLAWLSLEKFSFVADVTEFSEPKQVTLSFQQQPLGAVLDAIADAYHGRWERRGDIFTLRSAGRSQTVFQSSAPFAVQRAPGIGSTQTALTVPPRTATPLPLLPSTRQVRGTLAPLAPPARVTSPAAGAKGLSVPSVQPPRLQGTVVAPTAPRAALAPTVPLLSVTQNQKSQEESKLQMERAMRAAEEAIRKLHESGEWRQALERAMSGAQSDDVRKALEEAQRAMRELHQSKEWKDAWAKARQEIAKALESGKVTEGGKERAMTPQEREKLEKTYKSLEKMPDVFMDGKLFNKMQENFKTFTMPNLEGREFKFAVPELDKKHFEWIEKMKLDEKGFFSPKIDGNMFRFGVPGQSVDAEREAKIRQRIEEMRRKSGVQGFSDFRVAPTPPTTFDAARAYSFDLKRMRIPELLESLTPQQRQKQEKDGHLTLEDLTPQQRAMLGELPKEGNWTFSYSIGGKRLTIKNK